MPTCKTSTRPSDGGCRITSRLTVNRGCPSDHIPTEEAGAPYSTPNGVDKLISLGVGFATSWLGSCLYLRKLRKAVAGARLTEASAEAQIELLQAAGGTNLVAAATGPTRQRVVSRMNSAIRLHLEGMRADGQQVPAPKSYSTYIEIPA
jgi:hypothetical protein